MQTVFYAIAITIIIASSNGWTFDSSLFPIRRITKNTIANKIKEQAELFNNDDELEVINSSSEIFAPKIKEGDDFLKVLVKKALEEKKISLKNYKNKFTKPHTLNNIKSALIKPTKTSIPNFEQWAELLGFDWEIRIFDNGHDKNNPLKYDIVFRSDEGLLENRDE